MKTKSPASATRGSVLIAALIFAFVIGVSLTSYLLMASKAASMSQRAFLMNDAMNVAEAGLEQMLWAANQTTSGNASTVWGNAGWTVNGSNATRLFDSSFFTLSQNATAQAKVYVTNFDTTGGNVTATGVVKSIVTPASGPPMIKMIKVSLKRSSYFTTGLVAKNGITFSGNNASVDSWNSIPTGNATVPYSTSVRHASGSLAAVNVSATVSVQNADIYGYVSVGNASSSAVNVGSQGKVTGNFNAAGGTIDSTRISTNFTANLPDATLPTSATPITFNDGSGHNYISSGHIELPLSGDRGTNYVTINGTPYYYYSLQYIRMSGNSANQLTVKAGYNVIVNVTAGSGTDAVSTSGSAGVTIEGNASLAIYTAGNVDVTGNSSGNGGVANNNGQPIGFQVWGTNTSAGAQTISISGNGSLSAVVYAPEAAVRIVGNGEVYGAVVANSAELTGNANFHYDESLANFSSNNPLKITSWTELRSASERNVYASQLNGNETSF
jgi:Tfp pilus assembly protein PilV